MFEGGQGRAMAAMKETKDEMQFHPVAKIFDLMTGEPFSSLCADIKANGLREEIFLAPDPEDGNVLKVADGRNRYNACVETGTAARYRTWNGEGDLVSIIVSLNLHRRHLSESQRAMAAARLAKMKPGRPSEQTPQICGNISQTAAAKMLSVSERSVSDAKRVIEKGLPELGELVDKGEIAVSTAATLASMSPKKQKRAIARGRASGKKMIVKLRGQALKKMGRRGEAGCLCQSGAKFDGPSITAVMEIFALKAAAYARENGCQNYAGIFEGVVFDLAEAELSAMKIESAEKILAIIEAGTIEGESGLRERNDLQRLSKIAWTEFNDVITYLADYGYVEVL